MSRSEKAIFTNMCMIYDDKGNVLVQDRLNPDWPGITFPGGHINKEESFHNSVVREIREETGLEILNPILCGIKQFQTDEDQRYVVLFYKTNKFNGTIKSSKEGKVFWIRRKDLEKYTLAMDFMDMVKVFESNEISEFYYTKENSEYKKTLY